MNKKSKLRMKSHHGLFIAMFEGKSVDLPLDLQAKSFLLTIS